MMPTVVAAMPAKKTRNNADPMTGNQNDPGSALASVALKASIERICVTMAVTRPAIAMITNGRGDLAGAGR